MTRPLACRRGLSTTCFHLLFVTFLMVTFLPLGWSSEETTEESDDKLLENLALFAEILAYVQQEHLDTPDSK